MKKGVWLKPNVREGLNEMRLKHRLSYARIGALVKMTGETVRKALNGSRVLDYHQHALEELLEQYKAGDVKLEE